MFGVLPLERLANNLRYLRKQTRATQEGFAESLGFAFRVYQRFEGVERTGLRLSTLERLADSLGLEVWELLAPGIESRKPKPLKTPARKRKVR